MLEQLAKALPANTPHKPLCNLASRRRSFGVTLAEAACRTVPEAKGAYAIGARYMTVMYFASVRVAQRLRLVVLKLSGRTGELPCRS